VISTGEIGRACSISGDTAPGTYRVQGWVNRNLCFTSIIYSVLNAGLFVYGPILL
jgi:hypothetical protein